MLSYAALVRFRGQPLVASSFASSPTGGSAAIRGRFRLPPGTGGEGRIGPSTEPYGRKMVRAAWSVLRSKIRLRQAASVETVTGGAWRLL